MRDYIDIGSAPASENCEQLGPNYDYVKARKECQVFIGQIRRELGEEPPGATLKIKLNTHDPDVYLEVVCYYEECNKEAMYYAFSCESTSSEWDEESKKLLNKG